MRFLRGAPGSSHAQDAVGEDSGAQAAPSLQRGFRAGCDGLIHPVAGLAFRDAFKLDALHGEAPADKGVQIDAFSDRIAAGSARRSSGDGERMAYIFIDLARKERDLPFVVVFVIEEAVAADTAARNALNVINLKKWMRAGALTVMAEEIVTGRDEEMQDGDLFLTGVAGG